MNNAIMTKQPLREFLDSRMVRYSTVARELGISPSHLHHLMEGNRPITADLAAKLAALFGVDVADIVPPAPEEETTS